MTLVLNEYRPFISNYPQYTWWKKNLLRFSEWYQRLFVLFYLNNQSTGGVNALLEQCQHILKAMAETVLCYCHKDQNQH